MVFPGVLRGRPGPRLATILAEPTASKPVVPKDAFAAECSGAQLVGVRAEEARRDGRGSKKRRGPGPLRGPYPPGPRARLRLGGTASHLMASLFAARFRVGTQLSSPLAG